MTELNYKGIPLFESENHQVYCFSELVKGEGVQSNQFLIVNHDQGLLLDPGGDLTFTPLTIAVTGVIKMDQLKFIFASHQDPDIIASIDRWLGRTKAKVMASERWARFLPHLISGYSEKHVGDFSSRMVEIPDAGKRFMMGEGKFSILPAHFLHSVANLQIYDATSKILFSGDMGASMVKGSDQMEVEDFAAHIPHMEGFHQRYMVSNKVCRLWANMVRDLDIDMIVPQHGKFFKGKAVIGKFLDWIECLECGQDLLTQRNYRLP